MWIITRKNLFFFLSHIGTFTLFALVKVFKLTADGASPEKATSMVLVLSGMIIIWICSTVFFSELGESYSFLSLMPLTDREIVSSKLLLGGFAVLYYWLFLIILVSGLSLGPELNSIAFKAITTCCTLSAILVVIWYTGIFYVGLARMAPYIWGMVVFTLFVSVITLDFNLNTINSHGTIPSLPFIGWVPGFLWAIFLGLTFFVTYKLIPWIVKVKKMG